MKSKNLVVLAVMAFCAGFFLLGKRLLKTGSLKDFSSESYSLKAQINQPLVIRQPRIFCMILTEPESLKTRALTVLYIWASKCTNYKFVSLTPDYLSHPDNQTLLRKSPLNLLHPKGLLRQNYTELTSKVFYAFRDVSEEFGDEYDWFVKADGELIFNNMHQVFVLCAIGT
jgi:hypothetical protein